MAHYITSMDIADMFETIEDSNEQKLAIFSYLNNNLGLRRFIAWYNSYNNKEVVDAIEYTRDESLKGTVKLISLLTDLEILEKYDNQNQQKILQRILGRIDDKHVMLLENCLTNDLRVYYPGIDWDVFKEFGVEVK